MIGPVARRMGALQLLLSGCSIQSYQSTFSSAAEQVHQFNILFVIFFAVCALMYVLVILFLVGAIVRRRRAEALVVESGRHHESDPLMRTGLIAWGSLIAVGLVGLATASFFADRSMALAAQHQRLSVTVTGNQWWWEINYNSSDPSKTLRAANELHVPVGVPTHIVLRSNDVIHSLWIPSLAGKEDLIPGRDTELTITPAKTGLYRAQCAEFCGAQHAKMALVVQVDSQADFVKWWEHQLQPAPVPATPLAVAGYNYFKTRECALCHAVAGTPAGGTVGPDLTHLASRRTIAAGALPMSRGNLYGWVANPQTIKPGTKMPAVGLEPNELHSVVAYLETLK